MQLSLSIKFRFKLDTQIRDGGLKRIDLIARYHFKLIKLLLQRIAFLADDR